MRARFGVASVFVAIVLCANLTHADPGDPFGFGDSGCFPPSPEIAKCENAVGKALGKYIKAVIKCHTKAAGAFVKGTPFDLALCESNPATGKGAVEKYAAAISKIALACPGQCATQRAAALRDTFEALLDGPINEYLYACPGMPFPPGHDGNLPSSAAVGSCQGTVAKAIGKYAQALVKCHAKHAKTAAFSVESCESDTFTFKGAKEKYEAAIAGIVLGCPPCTTLFAHPLRTLVETQLDCRNGDIYCAGTVPAACEPDCPATTTTTPPPTTSTVEPPTTTTIEPPTTTSLPPTTTSTVTVTTTTVTTITLDDFLMYGTIGADGPTVTIEDRFGTETVDLGAMFAFAPPVDKNGEGIIDPLTNQACYFVPTTPGSGWIADVHNELGTHSFTIGNSVGLCVPTERAPLPPVPAPVTRDHFKCYLADFGPGSGASVNLATAFESYSTFALGLTVFCVPADKNGEGVLRPEDHLACFAANSPTGSNFNTTIRNQFHETAVSFSSNFNLLCVPSTATFRKCSNGDIETNEICETYQQGCSANETCRACEECETCPAAGVIPPGGGTVTGSTVGGSTFFSSSCGNTYISSNYTRLFEWTPSMSGTWNIDTCEPGVHNEDNTLISVREGTCGNFVSEIACNDNGGGQCALASRTNAVVVAGQTYTILVTADSNIAEGADFTLHVSLCGNAVCEAGEDPCLCREDCPNDPFACESCECGTGTTFFQSCSCHSNCQFFGNCCPNVTDGNVCCDFLPPNGICGFGEDTCTCPADCPGADPDACEYCECGGLSENCGCDLACESFNDCCANEATMCASYCGDNVCVSGEDACNCPQDCDDPNLCEPCECGFFPSPADNCGCDPSCTSLGDCCSNACSLCGMCP